MIDAELTTDASDIGRDGRLIGKRILIVSSYLGLGGAERQAINLAHYLMHNEGALVTFIGLSQPGRQSIIAKL